MGYVARPVAPFSYTPSSDILISNDSTATTTSATYTKIKEITLITTIYTNCRFQYSFDLRNAAAGIIAYATIYKNGVALSNEQSVLGNVFTTKTLTIDTDAESPWIKGDTIAIYAKAQAGAGTQAEVRNFKLEGVMSPFTNSME